MIIIIRDVRGTHRNVTFQNSSIDRKKTLWCKFVIVVNGFFIFALWLRGISLRKEKNQLDATYFII